MKKNKLREITEKIFGAAHNNSTVKCADGNTRVLNSQDNAGKSENPVQIDCQDKNAMKSVMRMLERYEGKLSRIVLRRGGASNRLILSRRKIRQCLNLETFSYIAHHLF